MKSKGRVSKQNVFNYLAKFYSKDLGERWLLFFPIIFQMHMYANNACLTYLKVY